MQGKKKALGILFMAALMAVTGAILLKGQPVSVLWANLKHLNPGHRFAIAWAILLWGFMSALLRPPPQEGSRRRFII